jgi:tripartite-type tricarboxylate transporter receptor subunit TctC
MVVSKWLAHGLLGLVAALAASATAQAQNYPTKNVRVVVPFAAAGPTDVIARIVGQKLGELYGHAFTIENVPGAGGNTGTAQVAKAPADGYTLLVVSTGFIVNPSLYARVPYDPVKDFAPVTLAAASPNVLVVNPDVPARSVKELVALIKSSPGKYSYAQPALGSTPHLGGELFKLTFDLDLAMVPFPGAAPAITSTIGGHTPIAFTALPPAITAAKEGKVRALAVMASSRVAALPDVPTMAEAGVPGQEADTLTGIVAPTGTPVAIVEQLQRDIARIVAQADVKDKLAALGFVPIANTPAEFGTRIKVEMEKWGKVVRAAKLKIE